MKHLIKKVLAVSLFASLSTYAFASTTDYTQYCPTLSQLQQMPFGVTAQYYYAGTNNSNITVKADIDEPQYIFTKDLAPKPQSIDASLTTFVQVSNTLRCNYTMINSQGYSITYPLYNHGSYQECADGHLVLTGSPC